MGLDDGGGVVAGAVVPPPPPPPPPPLLLLVGWLDSPLSSVSLVPPEQQLPMVEWKGEQTRVKGICGKI